MLLPKEETIMRTPILIALAAATALSSPAMARPHHGGRHEAERHQSERNRYARHDRDRHRHHRAYVAPYRDYSYRRLNVGYRLRPAYYGPRYVISDYRMYGLRAPGRYLRWVQYGPDLLLVNIRTGRVVEVLPGRFY
jgi:Ni/Co efflux regulator RcnB